MRITCEWERHVAYKGNWNKTAENVYKRPAVTNTLLKGPHFRMAKKKLAKFGVCGKNADEICTF